MRHRGVFGLAVALCTTSLSAQNWIDVSTSDTNWIFIDPRSIKVNGSQRTARLAIIVDSGNQIVDAQFNCENFQYRIAGGSWRSDDQKNTLAICKDKGNGFHIQGGIASTADLLLLSRPFLDKGTGANFPTFVAGFKRSRGLVAKTRNDKSYANSLYFRRVPEGLIQITYTIGELDPEDFAIGRGEPELTRKEVCRYMLEAKRSLPEPQWDINRTETRRKTDYLHLRRSSVFDAGSKFRTEKDIYCDLQSGQYVFFNATIPYEAKRAVVDPALKKLMADLPWPAK